MYEYRSNFLMNVLKVKYVDLLRCVVILKYYKI